MCFGWGLAGAALLLLLRRLWGFEMPLLTRPASAHLGHFRALPSATLRPLITFL